MLRAYSKYFYLMMFFFQELLVQTDFLRKLVQEEAKCCCENIEIFLPFINHAVLESIVTFMYTGDLKGSKDTVREGIDVLVNQFGFPQDLKKIYENSPEISQPIPNTSSSVNEPYYECECGEDFVTQTGLKVHRVECVKAKKPAQEALVEQDHNEECQALPRCLKPGNLGINWVQCDSCKNWLHNYCIGFGPDPYPSDADYICKVCNPNFKPLSPGPPSYKSAIEGNASYVQEQQNAQYDFPNENESFVDNIVIEDVQGGVHDPQLNENALSNGVKDVDDGGLFSSEDETEESSQTLEFGNENRHPKPSFGNLETVNTQPGSSNNNRKVSPLKIKIDKNSKKSSKKRSLGKQENGTTQDPSNPPPAKRPRQQLEKVYCLACNEHIPKNKKLHHAVSHYALHNSRLKDKLIHTETHVKCAIPGCEKIFESKRANKAKFHLFQVHKELQQELIEEVFGSALNSDQPRDSVDVGFASENPNLHLIL